MRLLDILKRGGYCPKPKMETGGMLDVMNGGYKKPLSSTGGEFIGNSHETGGMDVMMNGEPVAEVEGGEGQHDIQGQSFISSDSIINPFTGNTIADDMIKQEKKKGKLEKTFNKRPNDNLLANGIKLTNNKIEGLAQLQEQLKMMMEGNI